MYGKAPDGVIISQVKRRDAYKFIRERQIRPELYLCYDNIVNIRNNIYMLFNNSDTEIYLVYAEYGIVLCIADESKSENQNIRIEKLKGTCELLAKQLDLAKIKKIEGIRIQLSNRIHIQTTDILIGLYLTSFLLTTIAWIILAI